MTNKFLDTSALVKVFIDETGSGNLKRELHRSPDLEKAISTITLVEVRSALHRRHRNREITAAAYQAAIADLQIVRARWVLQPADDLVIQTAFEVVARHGLKSLDALQLASALVLRDEAHSSGDHLLFIASDTRLLTAATAEHLPLWNPEVTAAP